MPSRGHWSVGDGNVPKSSHDRTCRDSPTKVQLDKVNIKESIGHCTVPCLLFRLSTSVRHTCIVLYVLYCIACVWDLQLVCLPRLSVSDPIQPPIPPCLPPNVPRWSPTLVRSLYPQHSVLPAPKCLLLSKLRVQSRPHTCLPRYLPYP